MARSGEFRGNSLATRSLAGLGTAVLAAAALSGCGQPDECYSPRAISATFPGDPEATRDQATWTTGVLIRTQIPEDAKGLVVGFRPPNADGWHDSEQVPRTVADTVAVRIGPGAVQFSATIVANEGLPACEEQPQTVFEGPQSVTPTPPGAASPVWSSEG